MIRFYLILTVVVVCVLFGVNRFLQHPLHEKPIVTVNPQYTPLAAEPYNFDTLSFRYQYDNIHHHFSKPFFQVTQTGFLYRNDDALLNHYRVYASDPNPFFSDIGDFGLAVICLEQNMEELGMESLMKVQKKQKAFFQLVEGEIMEQAGMLPEAETAFNKEFKINADKQYIYPHYIKTLFFEKKYTELYKLLTNPDTKKYFPARIAAITYFKNGRLFSYASMRLLPHFQLLGFIASLLISLVWFFFLVKLNLYKPDPWKLWLSVFGISLLVTPFTGVLYDFWTYDLGFRLTGNVLNDLIYSIFGIGFIEELIKILPVVFILLFTPKLIREPYDLFMAACLSALSFAFAENLLYIDTTHAEIIRARGLMASVSHMFDSSLIAYALILALYRKKGTPVLNFILGLLLASFTHGFYDFWLINKTVAPFMLFSILFMIVSLLIWVIMLNNCLNQSPFFDYVKNPDLNSLRKYLISGITLIVLFEYVSKALLEGAEASNLELSVSLISVVFFGVFYASNFTNIDTVKGFWAPFSPERFGWRLWWNELIGKRLQILPASNSFLIPSEIFGSISGRIVIGRKTAFYRFIPDNPLIVKEKIYNEIILCPEDKTVMLSEVPEKVLILIPNSPEWIALSSLEKKQVKLLCRGKATVIYEKRKTEIHA